MISQSIQAERLPQCTHAAVTPDAAGERGGDFFHGVGLELRALYMLGKNAATETPSPGSLIWKIAKIGLEGEMVFTFNEIVPAL